MRDGPEPFSPVPSLESLFIYCKSSWHPLLTKANYNAFSDFLQASKLRDSFIGLQAILDSSYCIGKSNPVACRNGKQVYSGLLGLLLMCLISECAWPKKWVFKLHFCVLSLSRVFHKYLLTALFCLEDRSGFEFILEETLLIEAFALSFLLLPPVKPYESHTNQRHMSNHANLLKLTPQLSFQIRVHAFLFWASAGFLVPVGILLIRMSTRVQHGSMIKVLFYSHVIIQILAALLSTAGAALSVANFENSFNNTHQRIGLTLYALILVQPLMACFRPNRGAKIRTIWYFMHWFLGNGICVLGIANVYIGLHTYHERTLRSVRLWTVLFTAQVSVIAFIYMLQDRWDSMVKHEVLTGEQIAPTSHSASPSSNHKEFNNNHLLIIRR